MPARVGAAAYSCETRAVKSGNETFYSYRIYPGELLLTIMESFRKLCFRAEKFKKNCGSICLFCNIVWLLFSLQGDRPIGVWVD